MNRLALLFSLMIFVPALVAQSADYSGPREEKYALVTLTKYCAAVEDFSRPQQPRVFAQVFSGLGAASGWVEFSNRAAWRDAGKPQPLALVWYKDDKVVRVAITSKDDAAQRQPYTEYCYRADGSLARLRAVPELQTKCDPFLFHCDLTSRGERLYPPMGHLPRLSGAPAKPAAAAQLDVRDQNSFFLRLLQSEQTSFAFAPIGWPEYLRVSDLPFQQLLEVSAK